jgi:hypothetical protein
MQITLDVEDWIDDCGFWYVKAPKHMEGLLLAKSARIYTDTNGGATVSILEATKQKLEAEELLKKA